ncbi:D-2-hydroxyacid dehydrogenase [Paenibacillus sp. SI8]|uniref:D-2-hydroxyacid dehydrogenase n=1 Tax=unclassified Paenibacillus TaxID=185978 RepID=UPI003466A9F4
MRHIKAVLYADNAREYYEKLPPLPAHIHVLPCTNEDEAIQAVSDSQVLCCTGMFFPKNIFAACPQLELLHAISVGMEPLLGPDILASNVIVTNSKGANAKPVAEHALALLLGLSRNIHRSVRAQVQKNWQRESLRSGFEIEGLTLGIVGLGAIGQELAIKAHHLGMNIMALRRASSGVLPDALAEHIRLYPMEQLQYVLEKSDFVVICLPLTEETKGIIGEEQFMMMKPTAYVLNISRGQVIEEGALIKALQKNWIAGAGLDVFSVHPLPDTSPLWDMPNVLITPYISASSRQTMERAMRIFADNLDRLSYGLPLQNVVNKHIGY